MSKDIRTTAGETFTEDESRAMARLVFKRFGRDAGAAVAAWRRLLGNSCPEADFLDMIAPDDDMGPEPYDSGRQAALAARAEEDMDGDHGSALASAGFGTDEDYGYFGDE